MTFKVLSGGVWLARWSDHEAPGQTKKAAIRNLAMCIGSDLVTNPQSAVNPDFMPKPLRVAVMAYVAENKQEPKQ